MARFYLILGALVWLAFRSCHADGRVFVLEMHNASETGHEWASQACAASNARLASVADLWHAILECSFSVCTRGWMDGATVGTTICKSENGAGLRTVDVKLDDDIVEEEERRLDAFCVKDKGAPCGAPPVLPHTHLQSQTGLELGDELLFVCESGYSLASGDTSFSLLCDSCGEWYGLVQHCAKDDEEAHLDYEDKFPEGTNAYSDSEDGVSQPEEREEEEEENGETQTEGPSEGTDGMTGEGEEDDHAAGGHEEAGGETDDGNAGSVTDPPVSLLSQKHLFWFPSEAFHDDDHADTHASDHKHSGAKEAESGVEGAVDQGHHGEDHAEEEHLDNDHVKEEHHGDGHVIEEHHGNGHAEEEHHDDSHVEEEHHDDGVIEEEHHDIDHVEEEHHDDSHVEEEHHDDDLVEEEHHDDHHVEEEHHDDDHVEEEHHDDDHIVEEHHDDDHVEEEHHDDDHVEEEHRDDDHVEEEHHHVSHVEEEHHDDHAEEELPTDEVLQHTDKSWLDGYPVDEEFTKSTEIGSEEKGATDLSKEAEESVKSEEFEKATDSSEETFKGVIEHPGATEIHPTLFINVSDVTTAPPFLLHSSMEPLNADGSDPATPSGVGPYEMTLDTTAAATTVVYGSTGTTVPELFHHASLPTESNDATAFAEDITSVPFHVTLSPEDDAAEDELGSPAPLTTVLPDEFTSQSADVPSVLIHDIGGVDSDHHNLTKQSMPTEEPCDADACPSSRSSSLVAIVTVGVIVAVAGLALGAWLYRRRQRKSSHYQFNGTNSHTQNFEMQQTA